MYNQSMIIHQHTRRTGSPQAGTPHPDSTTTSASATGRPMRACSCSSGSNGGAADSAMASGLPYETEDSVHHCSTGSSPSLNGAGLFDRKRKCEGLDRLPRTPLPTLSSPAHLSSPRPRSATCSSDFLSTPTPSSICHHPRSSSSCTATRTDARVDEGMHPSDRSGSDCKRVRRLLQTSSSSSLLPLPASSLAARRRSIQGTPSEMAKRPKLEAAASTGHLNVPESTYGAHMPTHLDLSNQSDQDMTSAPPSASFSNLTITQPSSPAYAAFSLQTPNPACSPSSSSPMQFTFTRSNASTDQDHSQMPVDSHTTATSQSRMSDRVSTRRDKISTRPLRRRMKRASSLQLEDEITLARSEHHKHHRQTSTSLSYPSTHSHCDLTSSVSNTRDLVAKQGSMAGADQQTERRKEEDRGVKVQQPTTSECMTTTNVGATSRGEVPSLGSSSEGKVKEATEAKASRRKRSIDSQCSSMPNVEPVLQFTPAQLAAMHQFNMPKQARAAPPVVHLNRAVLPPYPSRTQAFAQAQRRLPASTSTISLANVSVAGSTANAHQPNFLYVAPPPLVPIPVVQDPVKPPPTASIPGYMPPIARDTLRELDLQEVLQCRQLRQDVVFDANLMFRPNFDGDRGDRKREAADRYWMAVTRELETGCKCTAYSFAPSATARMLGRVSLPLPCICANAALPGRRTSISERLPSRIVPLVQELRDILLALLPSAGSPQGQTSPSRTPSKLSNAGTATSQMIIDTLDPIFIAQEVAHGVLDVCSLAAFFGQIIKSHCAPMRDEIVELMVRTIKKGGQTNDMSTVSSGLRMCFEILELMKLDIANHQLRMLRPYLLETAADFEYKTFLHLRERRPPVEDTARILEEVTQGPPLTKTKAWIAAVQQRAALSATSQLTSNNNYCFKIVDGVLQLLFKPSEDRAEAPSVEKTSQNRQSSSTERPRKPKAQALPSSAEVPETLQLDIYRLQLFHGDIVDLCIVHLLLLLYRQLCSVNKRIPSSEDVEGIRRQIWIIMSEINNSTALTPSASGRRATPALSQSIKKLESEKWRAGMRDVLLQIARFSSNAQGVIGEGTFVPDSSTLAVLNSWMDNNFKPDSKLFQLVQTRLRRALSGLMVHEIQSSSKVPSNKPWDMAPSDLISEALAETDAIIKQNGLLDLTSEVRLLASRIAKVAGYNAHVFRELYADLL